MQRQLLLVQHKQQANKFLSLRNYTTLVISRNDKNKQQTLLSKRKLDKYTFWNIKSLKHLKILKMTPSSIEA